ncbi:hypothetical protein BGZ59_004787 [Podila verticillata]|nr:hypothetical protein BGZ59_004787 [Podila verticillata]KFH68511.1 hypothetical protein MVEG_05325 [Podila verticillata NRRL 6337]
MDRLTKQDNDALREHEWRLLFEEAANIQDGDVPEDFAQDTFMVKTQFTESSADKEYLILLTNLKQLWVEKLDMEQIRRRSKKIKSFDYEDDSQIEALLQSLSAIFSTEKLASASNSKPRVEVRDDNKLSLFVVFDFGLASVQWEFKLMPMLSASSAPAISLTEVTRESALTSIRKKNLESTRKRGRTTMVLENSDDEEYDDGNSNTLDLEDGQEDVEYVDGMSVFYDHLMLPLISIVNVYRHQVKSQESVIKAKENEVFEALELMEQSGVNHRNRRRVTEPYVNADADAKLQSNLERQRKPQAGPRELFSDKKIPMLCSIVTKNARPKHISSGTFSASQLDQNSLSQYPSSTPISISSGSASGPRHGNGATSSLLHVEQESVPKGSSKAEEELERRRQLEEKLEKEKEILVKKGKKKKLF